MATYQELIAHRLEVDQIRQHIRANSLGYLSLQGMLDAIREVVGPQGSYCTACFSREYPIDIPEWLFQSDREKMIFEEAWG